MPKRRCNGIELKGSQLEDPNKGEKKTKRCRWEWGEDRQHHGQRHTALQQPTLSTVNQVFHFQTLRVDHTEFHHSKTQSAENTVNIGSHICTQWTGTN